MNGHARWAVAAFAVYVAAIVVSNWLIGHVGIAAGAGPHLTPVGFGLMAPSGVWAAAVSFPARDMTQRLGGRWLGVAAILVGAGASWLTSDHRVALASGATYLLSESLDMALYTPLQGWWSLGAWAFPVAVAVSALGAGLFDSWVFLHEAGLPSGALAVMGLFLGKAWVALAAAPATWKLRKTGPVAVAA